jgi:hypothetical protein
VIDYSRNAALVGKTVYHYAQFPNDDRICIVEACNPASTEDSISLTDESTSEKYRFYIFSHVDLAANHTLSDAILEDSGITSESIEKIVLKKVIGDESRSEMVQDGEIDAAASVEILELLSGKSSISRQEFNQLHPGAEQPLWSNEQKIFEFVASRGNIMNCTFNPSTNIVAMNDCYFQLSDNEAETLSRLLSAD